MTGFCVSIVLSIVIFLILYRLRRSRPFLKTFVGLTASVYLLGLCSPSLNVFLSPRVRDERYRVFNTIWSVPSLHDLRIISNAGINFWAGFVLTLVIAYAVAVGLSRWLLALPSLLIVGAEAAQWYFVRLGRVAFAMEDVVNNLFGMIAAFALVAGTYVLALLIKQLRKPAEVA
jgi:hypothetical protein